MLRAFLAVVLPAFLLAGCIRTTIRFADVPTTQPEAMRYDDLALIYSRITRPTGTDYDALRRDLGPLDGFLSRIARVGPKLTAGLFPDADARTAYYVNVYHASTLRAVVERIQKTGGGNPVALDPRDLVAFVVDGRETTPAELRRLAIAQRPDDWRLPLALSGPYRSDPPLPSRPLSPGVLDLQLQQQALAALSARQVLWFDHGMQRIHVYPSLYSASGRLTREYQQRIGARGATFLNVLIELLPARRLELNSAVGYALREADSDRTLNSSHTVVDE